MVLAASPLAIGCFRALPYGSIYIMKNYSKLTTKKRNFIFENPNCFLPKTLTKTELTKILIQTDPSVPKVRFQTYLQTCIDRVTIV